jgi:hypothetical protein
MDLKRCLILLRMLKSEYNVCYDVWRCFNSVDVCFKWLEYCLLTQIWEISGNRDSQNGPSKFWAYLGKIPKKNGLG